MGYCTNFYNRNYCFGLIFGWVSVSLVWCCTTWYVCFSPLMYCYLNPQKTCFLSPCKNFYSKNYLFVLIFGLGLCEIFFFFLISMCHSLGVWLNAWETYGYCSDGLTNEAWNWLHASVKIQIANNFNAVIVKYEKLSS